MKARLRAALVGMVRGYQRSLSWVLPTRCRFYPSCSQYCIEALESHGTGRALWLSLRRLSRCHPLGGKGYDPVPVPPDATAPTQEKEPRPPGGRGSE